MQLSSIGTKIISIADSTGAVVKQGAAKGAAKAGCLGKCVVRQLKSVAHWTGSSFMKIANFSLGIIQSLGQTLANFVKSPRNLKITAVGVALLTTTVIVARRIFKKEEPTEEDSLFSDTSAADPAPAGRADGASDEASDAQVPTDSSRAGLDDASLPADLPAADSEDVFHSAVE